MNKMTTNSLKIGIYGAILLSLALAQPSFAQQYKQIKRLGTSQSLCAGGVETLEQLQSFVSKNPNVIRGVLQDSGWAGDADKVLQAIANGDLQETAYPVGTKMTWMGGMKNGSPSALPYREWAGKKSFPGFALNVSSDCRVYEMAIPKACCNISLISVSPDTSDACTAPAEPVAVAPAPVVEEQPVAAKALGLIPFYGLFAGSETRPRFEPAWNKDMKDTSGLAGIRVGLMKEICLLYTSPSPRDKRQSRMPSSA